jgi:serine/threonine protein kinase
MFDVTNGSFFVYEHREPEFERWTLGCTLMPDSSPHPQLETLFHDALEMRSEERLAFLSKACGSDDQLRDRVLALIAAFDEETGFLETPPALEHFGIPASQSLCALGEVLGHYRIVELLGRGGMGEVYLARDSVLGRNVALKLLPQSSLATRTAMARFWLEARTASALNHPNIMTVYEVGDHNGRHYIAAEYVEGSTIRRLLANGPLDVDRTLDIACQVAGGLAAAHAAGIIHRDIKPENIMVRPDGFVKILDFGLAKLTEDAGARQRGLPRNAATVPGILLGTAGYMSPEQARGLDLDTRSDLFSLGTVIHETATGRCPFEGKTPTDALSSVLNYEPPAIDVVNPFFPPGLSRVTGKLLAKNREDRYQTATELITDLEHLRRTIKAKLTAAQQKEPNRPLSSRPSQRLLQYGIIVLLLLVIGLAVKTVFQPTIASPASVNKKREFTYRWRVQNALGQETDGPSPASGLQGFRSGQRIRLYISSPEPGYLYLVNEALSPNRNASEFVTLSPSPTGNGGSPFVAAGREVAIPEKSWLQFDEDRGTERLWTVWSDTKVPILDAVAKYANPHDQGRISSPADEQAVASFLRDNYKPEALELSATPVPSIRGTSRVLVWRADLKHD